MATASGALRRTPPAIFPPILGLLGLGLAWRRAEAPFQLPVPVGELLLGAGVLVFTVALACWLAKPLRRPGVVFEELRVLPGRAGLAAMTLSLMLVAAALVPYAPGVARIVIVVALAAHLVLVGLVVHALSTGPAEARTVTPIWHLVFVGFIVAPVALVPLGHDGTARLILYATLPVAGAIWGVSIWQLVMRVPPAPLRPLLMIHLAPASLFASVAALLHMPLLAAGFAALGGAILLTLVAAGRWVLAAGFTPFWSALTFPLAAFAAALILLSDGQGPQGVVAGVVLVAATLVTLPVAARVLRAWARGGLAAATNAAEA